MAYHGFFRLTAAAWVALMALCLSVALICVAAVAAPTFSPSSAAQQCRDRRVAHLRTALLDRAPYHVEAIPDPPLEWGIHTPCKKFGRGCPDTYVQFLEELVTSLKGEVSDGDAHDVAGAVAEKRKGTENATCQAQTELGNSAATLVAAAVGTPEGCINGVDDRVADAAVSLVSLLPCDLRLPLQMSWPYEARKRLENLLHLLATRESELRRNGVAPAPLQRLYHVPSAEHIHLVEDLDGAITARLQSACGIGSASSAAPLPEGWTLQKWEDVYGLWCRHVEQQHSNRRDDSLSATRVIAAPPSSLVLLPRKVWHCTALHHATLYLQLLVRADQLLAWAWSWTFCNAVPSAFLVCVLLWLCVGDAWTDAAEAFVLNASAVTADATGQGDGVVKEASASKGTTPSATPHECRLPSTTTGSPSTPTVSSAVWGAEAAPSTSPVASVVLAEGCDSPLRGHGAVPASEHCHHQHQGQRERRAALLRWRFAASALHRSPTLFFLKLRLLLCLLVTGQLLWSVWRVLAASHDVTAAAAPLLQFLLPSWLLACLSAYLVVPLQMMVLGTALKGALSAHEELLSFQAKCAAEQRALLNAAGVLPLGD
ncbi:conserved hypothetical protein [Leishmania mexicana MHOM/GT/2001/U1103]|uniref:Uncharacterized protein n=1 Tax=Leishmania mexicana (strain MHOM/GT/2001/U1103) TaxID=929439 RepID=E9ALV3_LEIMU|nr:conserved hypothetical protein [Leishmania mexicana MHOM/GT/2001/U1103]CBZ23908.1 conserved hypothetical protein [Leishmania mexicana MHOM/GT/2001/U1103]